MKFIVAVSKATTVTSSEVPDDYRDLLYGMPDYLMGVYAQSTSVRLTINFTFVFFADIFAYFLFKRD